MNILIYPLFYLEDDGNCGPGIGGGGGRINDFLFFNLFL